MNIHQNIGPNATEAAFSDAYAAVRASLPGVGDGSLAGIRDAAMARFKALGLPHRRIEAWHYTDLRRLLGEACASIRESDAADLYAADRGGVATQAAFAGLKPARLVFAAGRFQPGLSDLEGLGDGVDIGPLSAGPLPDWALAEIAARRPAGDNAVFDLATALMTDGALIRVTKGHNPARPIEIVSLSSGGGSVLRHVVVLEDDAVLRLIEHAGGEGAMSLTAMTVVLGDRARLDHVKIQDEGRATTHLAPMTGQVGAGACINAFTLTLGAALAREERDIRFAGEDTRGSISGAFLLSGRTHADTTLCIDHANTGGQSREIFKGIVDGAAKSVVQTSVVVAAGAQKTDARQGVHVLLLSEDAEHNTKPELEIYADDVQCAHGATVGELDETALFYLMSRGITRSVAQAMLIEAFVFGAMEEIADDEFRGVICVLAAARLDERKAHG
ncbi:Iron-sulfur cluster assembly protein SufD [hydrothermal vent metagenome]|uniref:Iron-sulfur cluster assembly protein SufD n=1 Tax=hydrothermal vent metagenome TaxID=652676 RepID=A0A3B0U1Z5_9ZZZZ